MELRRLSTLGIVCALLTSVSAFSASVSHADLSQTQNSSLSGESANQAALSMGDSVSCAISDVIPVCWGGWTSNNFGTTVPVNLTGLVQISAGGVHACGVTSVGDLSCWGLRDTGAYPSDVLEVPANLGKVHQIAAGGDLNCAVLENRSIRCWGNPAAPAIHVPSDLGLVSFVALPGGYSADRACAITLTQELRCWGTGATAPVGLGAVKSISLGWANTCALKVDNSVRCWGDNSGITQVPASVWNVRAVSVGSGFACAVLNDNSVTCWGNSAYETVPGGLQATDVSVGWEHACARLISGDVACWGWPHQGRTQVPMTISAATLSFSSTDLSVVSTPSATSTPSPTSAPLNSTTPTPTPSFSVSESPSANQSWAPQVALGDAHSCAMLRQDFIRCWGNFWGPSVTQVPSSLSVVKQISAGGNHTCVITASRLVQCWGGSSWAGGMYPYESQVVAVPSDLGQVKQIAAGGSHNCAVLLDNTVHCWGSNTFGESAIPSTLHSASQVAVSGGRYDWNSASSCAVDQDSHVQCWGNNQWGQTNVPSDLGEVIKVSVGWFSACAITRSHDLRCWGSGTVPFGTVPQMPSSIGKVRDVAIGAYMACAIKESREVQCWGQGYLGSQVQPPNGLGQVESLALGWEHACVVTVNGGVVCWGSGGDAADGRAFVPTDLPTADAPILVSPESTPSASPVPPTVTTPGSPSLVSATPGDSQVTIDFAAPANDGGSAVTGYEYSLDGGATWNTKVLTMASPSFVLSTLTNGQSFQVSVRAVNAVGSGAASQPVSVKPIAPASAPTVSGVVAGNGRATLSISAPSQVNDSSLSGYDYSINNGSTWSRFASVDGPFTITSLTNGAAYQVKVRAVNSAGPGSVSDAVTVNPTKLVPAQPVISEVVAGNRSAIVKITKPADVTSQSITGYQYSIDKGSSYRNASLSDDSFSISGLTNGTATSVIVRAVNANGASKVSSAKTVVPATTPEAPVISVITPSKGALSIAFTAPNNGGKAISSYQYSLDGGSTWVVPTRTIGKSPAKIIGLPNATDYQVKIRAVNVLGIGESSATVLASTPAVVASSPTITSTLATKTTITVNFTAPTNNGGAAVTNYAYTVDGRTWTNLSPASASTQIVITGLTSYKAYSVKLRAINSAGLGAISASQSVKTLK